MFLLDQILNFDNQVIVKIKICDKFPLNLICMVKFMYVRRYLFQCWTEGRSSTAAAEDLRPKATATVAEV